MKSLYEGLCSSIHLNIVVIIKAFVFANGNQQTESQFNVCVQEKRKNSTTLLPLIIFACERGLLEDLFMPCWVTDEPDSGRKRACLACPCLHILWDGIKCNHVNRHGSRSYTGSLVPCVMWILFCCYSDYRKRCLRWGFHLILVGFARACCGAPKFSQPLKARPFN